MTQYIGMTELTHVLGVCEQTIRNWINKKKLPPPAIVTERGWRLWDKREIEQLAQERAKPKNKENQI
jgi:predicted DNA-binding transcriptional regulator AlpA